MMHYQCLSKCPHCGEPIDESQEEFVNTVGETPCCNKLVAWAPDAEEKRTIIWYVIGVWALVILPVLFAWAYGQQ